MKESWLLGLPNYTIEDLREEIFEYYNKKEYLKEQLQTNAQFRETLCEMIDINSIEIQDWGKGNDFEIAQEASKKLSAFLLNLYNENTENTFDDLDFNVLQWLLTSGDIRSWMSESFFSQSSFTDYLPVQLYKQAQFMKLSIIFAWKKLYENAGIISKEEWLRLNKMVPSSSYLKQMTIEWQKAYCLFSYMHFKLFQQLKKEKEIINKTSEIVGKSKLELLNKELRSDMIDRSSDPWLHLEPIITMLKNFANTENPQDLEKLIVTYPYLDFIRQNWVQATLLTYYFKSKANFVSFKENQLLELLTLAKWYKLDSMNTAFKILKERDKIFRDESWFDKQYSTVPFLLRFKIHAEIYFARIEWRFEQPEEVKETMFDVKYSRVFEEIMKWKSEFCSSQIYQNELLHGLKERLMKKFDSTEPDSSNLIDLCTKRKEWISETILTELSGKYIEFENMWLEYKFHTYLEQQHKNYPWKFSETFSSRLFDKEWKCAVHNLRRICRGYLIEQEIIAFLKELDHKAWEHIDENIFDNELEELKSKIPIYLDTTDSWLVDQLFWAYNIESDWRFKWWSTVLREQFPEFAPVTSKLETGHLISLPIMVNQVNKDIFENLNDDDSLLFLEYIHQKIWWEEKKNEMLFDWQIVMDIINKFKELSLSTDNSDNSFRYNRNIYISILQVYRNIYIKRKQAPISFPQKFEGTMFDEEYNEIFNMIMNSTEDDILKRDDLTKLWLWKLVADLWVLEWENQSIDTTMWLKYLSQVYYAWLQTAVKSFTVLWDEYCMASEEPLYTWENIFTDSIFNGFLWYVYQKDSYIYTDIKKLLQNYKWSINVILAWVEYEKTIIESLKQLKEKKIAQSQWPTKESIIAKLSKTYPQDLIMFAQFLLEWGELLKEENSAIEMKWELSRCKLSELIGMSRFMPQEIVSVQDKNQLDTLIKSFTDNKNFSNTAFTRDIYSSIEGQDKSSMIYIREKKYKMVLMQSKKPKETVMMFQLRWRSISFAEHGNWVTQIQDPVGMNLHKVLNYLLIPWNSDKDGDDWQTGMFGQWFRSSAIWAKELRIKTSPGDGQLYQFTLLPIYNEDNNLDDFAISVSVSQENFKGTIIERVDDKSWIQANLRAMIWVHNMQKYVGNVESIDIMYGKQKINTPEKNIVLQSTQVPWYGEMKLIKTSDNIVRWTKDNLYINEIPDDFLLDIPARMKEYVESQNLTIDIPPRFWLTKSRNAMADYDEQLQTLRPHLFDMLINYILKEVVKSQLRIPMLPEDYFGLDLYERRQTESSRIAQRYSNGLQLTDSEIDYLKDKAHMAEFLVQIPFEWNGNTLSLLEMKRRRNDDNIRNMMNMQWWLFGQSNLCIMLIKLVNWILNL